MSEAWKSCTYSSQMRLLGETPYIFIDVQVYNHMYDWFIMGSRCIFTKWDQTSIITIMMPHFASYKTPFFAVYQLLGAGVYHKKVKLIHLKPSPALTKVSSLPQVTASIQLLSDPQQSPTNSSLRVPILTNFTHILPPAVLGIKFVTAKKRGLPKNHSVTKGGHKWSIDWYY